jgi:hypothetical protein
MPCLLCDAETEEVEVECNETHQRVHVAVCDSCLIDSEDDSFALSNLVQAKLDVIM